MADPLGEDLLPKAGARDYHEENGEFPLNDPPVPTFGGRRSDIYEEALEAPGTSTPGRRAITSLEIDQKLAEYDSRRGKGRLSARSRRSAYRPGLVCKRGDATKGSG